MANVANALQLRGQLSAAQCEDRHRILSIFIFDVIVFGDKLSEGVFCFFI